MIDISPIQILIVLVIALMVFGPKRLPEMGRTIGRGIREFRGALTDDGPPPARRSESSPAPAATATSDATDATGAADEQPPEDDMLEGVVVSGDTPPAPPRPSDS